MDLTMDEFMRLADDKSQQAMRIAELERQLAVKTSENTRLTETVKVLEAANMAAKLENMMLRNYITLSVEKIKAFVSRLKGIERFAFLKTFLEYVLPQEHYQEQLLLVNEVMTLPDGRTVTGDTHTHYVTLTGSDATYNENPKE
jgi:hypothetical protein